jgi:hypothetical protein
MTTITQVKKRSGEVVDFKTERIANAIYRAAVSVGGRDKQLSEQLAGDVVKYQALKKSRMRSRRS